MNDAASCSPNSSLVPVESEGCPSATGADTTLAFYRDLQPLGDRHALPHGDERLLLQGNEPEPAGSTGVLTPVLFQ